MLEMPQIKYSHVNSFLNICFKHTNTVPIILGTVGLGKSTLAHEYAQKHNLYLIEVPLSSMYEMDLIGYASPNPDRTSFTYLPCDLFPLEDTPIPEGYKGFLILLEEFTNCHKSIQTAAQRIILDKCVGKHKIHPKAYIMAVGNTMSAGTNSIKMNTALRTRSAIVELSVHYNISEIKEFINKTFHPLWIKFLNTKRILECYVPKEDEIEDGQTAIGCGRTFHEASKVTKAFCNAKSEEVFIEEMIRGDSSLHTTIAGIIGHRNAQNFKLFLIEHNKTNYVSKIQQNTYLDSAVDQILFEYSLRRDTSFIKELFSTQDVSINKEVYEALMVRIDREADSTDMYNLKQYLEHIRNSLEGMSL